MQVEYLFVYGTLRKKLSNQSSSLLKRQAKYIGEATFQGQLYQIQHYPGAIHSNHPKNRVVGDVFQLLYPRIALTRLDNYEGFGAKFPTPNEFVRQQTPIQGKNQRMMIAWIYLYNWPVNPRQRISSGDFLHRRQ